ncbi:thioredoxin family protein [Flavobacterium sp.]|uniref:thioredoxin family protein n=1 Tax=Flavobacterium sp. TaxID=239 RepID=UPI0025BA1E3E|nr:thioredoxin family protein [Flavobacterium sp.]MBA4154424.1 thioredoxin family protein [Flavobacterium sp.]
MKKLKIVLLVIVAGLVTAFTKSNPDGYEIGSIATDFSLKNVDNKKVSLKDYKDAKGFIVIFTCNHCPYAVAYEDRIIELDKKYKKLGYPVIAINPNNPEIQKDDSFDKMKVRAKEKGFTFPYLFDDGQKIYPQYGATKTPHVYVLQKTNRGNVVQYIGAIDDNHSDETAVKAKYVENAVDELLSGKAVTTKTTKAIGCSIKA